MHCDVDALVQEMFETQFATGVHSGHVSCTPSCRYLPGAHCAHCAVVALVHVSGDTQPLIPLHGTHDDPSGERKYPDSQLVHDELDPVLHETALVQCGTGVHVVQADAGPLLSR